MTVLLTGSTQKHTPARQRLFTSSLPKFSIFLLICSFLSSTDSLLLLYRNGNFTHAMFCPLFDTNTSLRFPPTPPAPSRRRAPRLPPGCADYSRLRPLVSGRGPPPRPPPRRCRWRSTRRACCFPAPPARARVDSSPFPRRFGVPSPYCCCSSCERRSRPSSLTLLRKHALRFCAIRPQVAGGKRWRLER